MGISKNQVHDGIKICGAETRAGTPCQQVAGWGTDHVGSGRCKLHGGKSTGPKNQKGNKNSVKTGEHEAIWLDTLEDDEQYLYRLVNTDKLQQVNQDIKLTDIRIRRMLGRINNLKAAADKDDLVLTSRVTKKIEGTDIDLDEDDKQHVIDKIQNIEDALTRVQSTKVRLIRLKHDLEKEMGLNEELIETKIAKEKAETKLLELQIDEATGEDIDQDNIDDFIAAMNPSEKDISNLFNGDINE